MGHERKEIRVLSAKYPKLQTLINYVNVDTLKAIHELAINSKGVIHIDQAVMQEYHNDLEHNLLDLISRMKDFSYRPRKLYNDEIEQTKYLYEDRLVEGCMTYVLYEVYEPRFLEITYNDVETANKMVNKIICNENVKYVLECTIQDIFLNIQSDDLINFIRNDIGDENFVKYIMRFLQTGIIRVFEREKNDGSSRYLMTPILVDIYLHYVIDLWFKKVLVNRLTGIAKIVRFKDKLVFLFEYEETARTVYKVLNIRVRDFNLSLTNCKAKILPVKQEIEGYSLIWFTDEPFPQKPLNAKI